MGRVDHVLPNSFGFGGINARLVFGRIRLSGLDKSLPTG